jgi:hypothetical protein
MAPTRQFLLSKGTNPRIARLDPAPSPIPVFASCTYFDHYGLNFNHCSKKCPYIDVLPSLPCSATKTRSRGIYLMFGEGSVTADLPMACTPAFQRARGILSISATRTLGDITRLQNLRQEGSYRVIFPRAIGGQIEAVIINTAGGVTGGDKFSTSITAGETAQIKITTQAAERIYRAPDAMRV